MSTSRLTIMQRLAQETGLGTLVTLTGGSTTTMVDTTSVLTGPYSAQRFARGTPVRYTTLAGAASAESSAVDSYAPLPTGTIGLLPATTASVADDAAQIWTGIDHVNRVLEAIDRGLTRHCFHWVPIPLTDVPDGDMGDSAYAHWTASASTVTKVSQAWPASIGQRYLRVLNAGYAASDAIKVQAGDQWLIDVLVYVAVGAANLVVYDGSNAAAITLNGDSGTYSGTGWKRLNNTFTIPSGCETITIRLGSTGANDDTYWTHVIAGPQMRRRFTLPARITSKQRLGEVLVRCGEEYEDFYFDKYVTGGRTAGLMQSPVGMVVDVSGGGVPYIEEVRAYEALASDAATTECAEDLAVSAGKFEFYKYLAALKRTVESKSGYITASDMKVLANDALAELKGRQASLGAESKEVWR